MYDLEVEETHNFCLASGVVVHNSEKDVCDAVVTSLSTCFRMEGVTREEVVASQFLTETDDSERFYDDLMGDEHENGGFYADLLG